jgi:hypothetical protein
MPTTPLTLESVLNRPAGERAREYKYRFAQALVFGLPVVGLEFYGRALGGVEAERWVRFLQGLLAGWVMYIGASGMLLEGVLRKRVTLDFLVAASAVAMYCVGWFWAGWFSGTVLLIAIWTGLRWWMSRRWV